MGTVIRLVRIEFLFLRHLLRDILSFRSPRSTLVFTGTKLEAVELSHQLSHAWKGGGVDCLHGDLPQYQRTRVLQAFRSDRLERTLKR